MTQLGGKNRTSSDSANQSPANSIACLRHTKLPKHTRTKLCSGNVETSSAQDCRAESLFQKNLSPRTRRRRRLDPPLPALPFLRPRLRQLSDDESKSRSNGTPLHHVARPRAVRHEAGHHRTHHQLDPRRPRFLVHLLLPLQGRKQEHQGPRFLKVHRRKVERQCTVFLLHGWHPRCHLCCWSQEHHPG